MGVELLYNSVKTVPIRVGDRRDVVGRAPGELQLEIGRSYRRDVVGKATPGRGSREVADKMQ